MAIAVMAIAVPVFAQDSGGGQSPGGVFGRSTTDPKARQVGDLTVTSTGGYDAISRPEVDAAPSAQDSPGYSTMLETSGGYAFHSRSLQIRATGISAERYFSPVSGLATSSFQSVSHSAALGLTAGANRTKFTLNQTGTYSSSPLYSLFSSRLSVVPGEAPLTAPAYGLNALRAYSYGTTMSLAQELTTRTTVSTNLEWNKTDTRVEAFGHQVVNTYAAGAQVEHRLSRNTATTAGYTYRLGEIDYGIAAIPRQQLPEHAVQFGVNRQRTLGRSRSMTIGAVIGGTTMLVPQFLEAERVVDVRYNRVWGQMSFVYQFDRRWQSRAEYRQGIEYLAGLSQPIFAKTVSAKVTGLLTPRIDMVVSGAYATGQSALAQNTPTFDTYTGDARLRFALSQKFAGYVEYVYYVYNAKRALSLALGMPPMFERNSVRVGLVFRVPSF